MLRFTLLFNVVLSQYFEPLTLSFKALQEDTLFPSEEFEQALTQDGLVSIFFAC